MENSPATNDDHQQRTTPRIFPQARSHRGDRRGQQRTDHCQHHRHYPARGQSGCAERTGEHHGRTCGHRIGICESGFSHCPGYLAARRLNADRNSRSTDGRARPATGEPSHPRDQAGAADAKKGKSADIVAMPGEPTADIRLAERQSPKRLPRLEHKPRERNRPDKPQSWLLSTGVPAGVSQCI